MFKSIKDTLDKGVAAVSVKSESIVESSRVRTAIATAQKTMDQELSALGVKCYNSWLSGGTDQEELEAACQKIKAIQIELTGLKDRLEQIKEEENEHSRNQLFARHKERRQDKTILSRQL